MPIDIWFRQDVIRILRALASAGEERGWEYRKALNDVAIAFGLTEQQPQPSAGLSHPQHDGGLAWPELQGGDEERH